jgi:hypothetical protein
MSCGEVTMKTLDINELGQPLPVIRVSLQSNIDWSVLYLRGTEGGPRIDGGASGLI